MAYSDKVWKDSPDHTTPLSAAGLNDWEARIKAETDALSVLAGTNAIAASGDSAEVSTASGRLSIISKSRAVNPHSSAYGAVGDGTTDDRAALALAVARASVLKVPVALAGADYKLSSLLDIGAVPIVGAGLGRTRLLQGSSQGILRSTGSTGTAVPLTANAVVGDKTLTMAAAPTGTAAGSFLLLYSSALWPVDPAGQTTTRGEIVRVRSVSGTTVNLVGAIMDSYATADTASVKLITTTAACVRDLTCENPTPGTFTSNAAAIVAKFALDPLVGDVGMVGLDGAGVRLSSCIHGVVDGVVGSSLSDDPTNNRFGYLVHACDATVGTRIQSPTLRVGRHAFTTSSDDAVGVPRHIVISDGRAYGMTGGAWDTHWQGDHIEFVNCETHGGRSVGFYVRAPNTRIVNPTVNGAMGSGISGDTYGSGLIVHGGRISHVAQGTYYDGDPATPAASYSGQGRGVELNAERSTVDGTEIADVDRQAVVANGWYQTMRNLTLRRWGAYGANEGIALSAGTRRNVIKDVLFDSVSGSSVGITTDAGDPGYAWVDGVESIAGTVQIQDVRLYDPEDPDGTALLAAGTSVSARRPLVGTTATTAAAGNDARLLDALRSQYGQWAGLGPADTSMTATASRCYFVEFVPQVAMSVTAIGFVVVAAAGSNDSVDVGIFDSSLTKLVSSGTTAGEVNATGARTIAVASTALTAGTRYFLGFGYGTAGGSLAGLLAQTGAATNLGIHTMLASAISTTPSSSHSGMVLASTYPLATTTPGSCFLTTALPALCARV